MNADSTVVANETELETTPLTAGEREVAARLHELADRTPNWATFANEWRKLVIDYYGSVRRPRNQIPRSALYRIGRELDSKVKVAFGVAQPSGYRDQLLELSRLYPSRKQFCEAVGISEDMLSHVVHGRKDFSIAALQQALARIGYTIKIVPVGE